MTICDICNGEDDGVVVPVLEFQRHVATGRFDPIRLGLTVGRASWTDEKNLSFWMGVVQANETDWFLCLTCHLAYHETTAAAPAPTRDNGWSSFLQSNLPGTGTSAPARDAGDDFPDSLETLRRLHPLPAPPGVPAKWQPGWFFGRGKPWGDTDQAVALIRHGRIAEARELLLRIVAHSNDLSAKLLLCLESRRPPHDAGLKPGSIVPLLPPAERAAVDALFAFNQIDYGWLGEAMLTATAQPPNSESGAFHLLPAAVAGADLWFQTQILYPRKREMKGAIVKEPGKGLALLLERRHDEAWQTFSEGVAAPESSISGYGRILQADLSSKEEEYLIHAMRGDCEIGRGLVLFDLGYNTERRALFRRIAPLLTGSEAAASACRMLA